MSICLFQDPIFEWKGREIAFIFVVCYFLWLRCAGTGCDMLNADLRLSYALCILYSVIIKLIHSVLFHSTNNSILMGFLHDHTHTHVHCAIMLATSTNENKKKT